MTSLIDQRVVDKLSGAPESNNGPSLSDQARTMLQGVRFKWVIGSIAAIGLTALAVWNIQITLVERDVNKRLASAQSAGEVPLPSLAQINGDLSAAEADLELAREAIVAGLADARLSLELISLGDESGIWVRSTALSPESFESVGDRSFPAKSVQVVADAPIDNTIAYVEALDEGAIEGLEIFSLDMSRRSPTSYRTVINSLAYRQLTDTEAVDEEDDN